MFGIPRMSSARSWADARGGKISSVRLGLLSKKATIVIGLDRKRPGQESWTKQETGKLTRAGSLVPLVRDVCAVEYTSASELDSFL